MKRRTSRKTERCFRRSVLARCLLFSVAKTLSWARRNSVSQWHKPSYQRRGLWERHGPAAIARTRGACWRCQPQPPLPLQLLASAQHPTAPPSPGPAQRPARWSPRPQYAERRYCWTAAGAASARGCDEKAQRRVSAPEAHRAPCSAAGDRVAPRLVMVPGPPVPAHPPVQEAPDVGRGADGEQQGPGLESAAVEGSVLGQPRATLVCTGVTEDAFQAGQT